MLYYKLAALIFTNINPLPNLTVKQIMSTKQRFITYTVNFDPGQNIPVRYQKGREDQRSRGKELRRNSARN
jgi:hypothetical protein